MSHENFIDTPLSKLQEGLWFFYKLDPKSATYNAYINYKIEGDLDIVRFKGALLKMCNFFPAFRTRFIDNKNCITQRIYNRISHIPFSIISLEDKKSPYTLIKRLNFTPFDIKSQIYQFYLIIHKKDYYFISVKHHIITDGFSGALFMKALGIVYNNTAESLSNSFSYQTLKDFNDYLALQPKKFQEEQNRYWKTFLSGSSFNFNFGYGFPRLSANIQQYSISNRVGKELYKDIKNISRKHKTLPFLFISAVWGSLLFKYFSNHSFLIGYPENIRPREFSKIYGYFVTVLPLKIDVLPDTTFETLLTQITTQKKLHRSYTLISLYELSKLMNEKRSSTIDFNVGITPTSFYNEQLQLRNCKVISIQSSGATISPDRDLSISCDFETQNLEYSIFYNSNLFTESFINQLHKHFLHLIKLFSANTNLVLNNFQLIDDEDKRKILAFNTPSIVHTTKNTIHHLFEKQAFLTPDKIAIKHNDKQISYKTLNETANQFAKFLIDQGVKPESLVAIYMDRSIDAVITILGILKAGGAYVPIDTEFPIKRVQDILDESQSAIMITNSNNSDLSSKVRTINFAETITTLNKYNKNNISVASPNNLAYVIFTSGSTGKPKGVMVEHRSVIALLINTNFIKINSNDIFVNLSSFAFDGSIFDIFGSLFYSATLHIVDKKEILNTSYLAQYISTNKITIFFCTTALFNNLIDNNPSSLKHLKSILFGGEACSPDHINKALDILGTKKLIHVYGPTEATTFSTFYSINNKLRIYPIGQNLTSSTSYILDTSLNMVPVGIAGELYIGGDGLARGYLNNKDLTQQKFIQNPFSNNPNSKLYKTGDLVKWHDNGNIEFLGRIDNQVKIRGFRIELSEIENTLLEIDYIKSAIALVHENKAKNKSICAYLILQSVTKDISFDEINAFLKKTLPNYMIPANYVILDKLPLTTNGKIDLKKLPLPKIKKIPSTKNKLTKIEYQVTKIFSQILCIDKDHLKIHFSFFDLGGDSLQIMRVIALIKENLKVDITVKEFLDNASISEMSNLITNKSQSHNIKSLLPTQKKDVYTIPPNLKQMFLLSETEHSIAYNVPFLCKLPIKKNISFIENKLMELLNMHDAYHLSFGKKNRKIVAFYNQHISFSLRRIRIKAIDQYNISSLVTHINIKKAPLVNIILLESNDDQFLFVDHHHIIADKISIDIFLNQLFALFSGNTNLPLKINYLDYLQYQSLEPQKKKRSLNTNYWINKLKNKTSYVDLPYDFQRPPVFVNKGNIITSVLEEKIGIKILTLLKDLNCTPCAFFLGIFSVFINKYSQNRNFIIGVPSSIRSNQDTENLIGYFVNVLPLNIDVNYNHTFYQFCNNISDVLIKSLDYQDFDFSNLVKTITKDRNYSRHPLFDLVFNYNEIKKDHNDSITPIHSNIIKFDLVFSVMRKENIFILEMEYASSLFKYSKIQKFLNIIIYGIQQVLRNPNILIPNLDFTSEEDKKKYISWHHTNFDYIKNQTIHHLFEKQASINPNKIAIQHNNKQISYKSLNEIANQFAKFLINQGVKPESLVALYMHRSIETIVTILAILKAGGAYVPIDTESPIKRVKDVLSESKSSIIITNGENLDLPNEISMIDFAEIISKLDKYENNNITTSSPRNLAYVIFTSGSTGKPKGVMVEHHALVNLVSSQKHNFDITPESNFAHIQSIAFDASVDEIFSTLLNGACLCIIDKNTLLTPNLFSNYISQHKISHLLLPASFLSIMHPRILSSVKVVIAVGDKIFLKEAKTWSNYTKILNGYGPSEATICTSVGNITNESNYPSIGKAIDHKTIYILDNALNIVPIGVAGELYVGGEGLARGYLNNQNLTQQKFIKNPFSNNPNCKLYKTGDLAKWHEDGNIEFLGRIDNQVKIRGFRIELSEIENALLEINFIKSAIAIVHENKNKSICAYIILKNIANDISFNEVSAFLKKTLPSYMIPANYIVLDKLPLTTNGKTDIKKLPLPDTRSATSAIQESLSNTEKLLIKIISSTINTDPQSISIHDNFFNIGGDSLSVIDVQIQIQEKFQKDISFSEIYKATSLKQLAKLLSTNPHKCINSNLIIPLNAEFNDMNVFFIHGASGTCHLFTDIANNLNKTISLYGIEAPQRLSSQFNTIQKLAKLYFDKISSFSNKPYYIAAWSFGSIIVMEMLKLFKANSIKIPHIFLLDPHNVYQNQREILWLFFFEQILNHHDYPDTFKRLYEQYKNIDISFNTLYEMFSKHKMLLKDKILLEKLYKRYHALLNLDGISQYTFHSSNITIIRPKLGANDSPQDADINELSVNGNHFSMLEKGANEVAGIIKEQYSKDLYDKNFIAA